jgi:type IV protein arginine methyltransferase
MCFVSLKDAVMMEWERPLMKAHAQILMESSSTSSSNSASGGGKSVLNVGFGMGIIDSALQELYQPKLHIIIEAHPDVYKRMLHDKWDQKQNVRICFGKWQDVIPQLIAEKVVVDAIFYDTVRLLMTFMT